MHIQDQMTEPELDERGFVTALRTKGGLRLDGDLFIDCSGFRGLLINKAMAEPFLDMSDHLFYDSAVATNVPHDDATAGIEPFTSSIAMDVGLDLEDPAARPVRHRLRVLQPVQPPGQGDRGFLRAVGARPAGAGVQQRSSSGSAATGGPGCATWSASACPPVRRTAGVDRDLLHLPAPLYHLVRNFPDLRFDPVQIDRFNAEIETMFDDTRDFLQAHFYFSPRDGHRVLAGQQGAEPLRADQGEGGRRTGPGCRRPAGRRRGHLLRQLRGRVPQLLDQRQLLLRLAGLGVLPDQPLPLLDFRPEAVERAEPVFAAVRRRTEELVATAPTMQAYLRRLHQGT